MAQTEDKFYLYEVADDGAKASVSEFRRFVEDAVVTEDIIEYGSVQFDGAQNPIRLDDQGCSVVTQGAVTPREDVVPVFMGAFQIATDFWATLWGYTNPNAYIVDQPRRTTGLTRNRIISGTAEQQALLPELFATGTISEAFVMYTAGEEVKWELETQSGGGVAVTDYTVLLTEEQLSTFDAFIVRQNYPGFLRYSAENPLLIKRISEQDLGKITLNQAGLGFDNITVVRHTEELNDDIPNQAAWYGRNLACRMEGGALQAHADASRASRILAPELGRELARGNLFTIPDFNVVVSAENKLPDAQAQASEQGNYIGANADGSLIVLGATEYDGANNSEGHVQYFNSIGALNIGTIGIPAGWTSATNLRFGRISEINSAGTMLFVTGEGDAPGVAVFTIDSIGTVAYWKTLTWSQFTSTPIGERALNGRFSDDGTYFIMTNGTGTVAGQVHVLYSDDNWQTFEVKNVFSRSDASGSDSFGVIDIGRDGLSLVVGAPDEDLVYAYRTTDGWDTFTEFKLTNPSDISAGSGSDFGSAVGISGDGFRIVVGSPLADIDYGAGVLANVGAVDIYLYNNALPGYGLNRRLPQPETLSAADNFGEFASFNHPGNRIGVLSKGKAKYYLYGIDEDTVLFIADEDDALVASATDMRWESDSDTLIASDKLADGIVPADIGAYKTVTFAEEP